MKPAIHYLSLADDPAIGPAAIAAASGDHLAALAVADWLEEEGQHVKCPFKVGKSYLICTVTLYYVGRVVEADLGWVRLEEASWVHWTGRLSTLLSRQSFTHRDLAGRKPRVEPCGEAIVALGAVVSAYPWSGPLPSEAI